VIFFLRAFFRLGGETRQDNGKLPFAAVVQGEKVEREVRVITGSKLLGELAIVSISK